MEISNQARAKMVKSAVEQHAIQKGAGDEDLASQISDFVADIAHLCEQDGIDFSDSVERGLNHYDAEVNQP